MFGAFLPCEAIPEGHVGELGIRPEGVGQLSVRERCLEHLQVRMFSGPVSELVADSMRIHAGDKAANVRSVTIREAGVPLLADDEAAGLPRLLVVDDEDGAVELVARLSSFVTHSVDCREIFCTSHHMKTP